MRTGLRHDREAWFSWIGCRRVSGVGAVRSGLVVEMRVAVVGAGVSGLVVAHLLHRAHDVTVFEANAYAGGHTNTVRVDTPYETHQVDTGFIVFNDRNYPNFERLLERLGVGSAAVDDEFQRQRRDRRLRVQQRVSEWSVRESRPPADPVVSSHGR